MGKKTEIEWCDSSWSPWHGCSICSPGCQNCYALRQARRNPKVLGVWGPKGTRVLKSEAGWREPEQWNSPKEVTAFSMRYGRARRVFCASIADVFEKWDGQMTDARERPLVREPGISAEEARPFWEPPARDLPPYTLDDARGHLWSLIRRTPHLNWLLLTKRPENIPKMMPAGKWPNVWLGTSVESQDWLWRADALVEAPQQVPVRFLSCEPLLGPVELGAVANGIQWLILGGESGSGARSMGIEWAHDLNRQCKAARVPFFMKQMGVRPDYEAPQGRWTLPMTHDPRHGGDVRDFPPGLAVREFPREVGLVPH